MAESEEELKSLLMKMKEESEKVGLKFNIQKMKIITSGPITSWQIDGETMETVRDLNEYPEYSFEGPMLKLKLQYFGHLVWRTDSLEKALRLSKLQELVMDRETWLGTVHVVAKSATDLNSQHL